MTDPVIFAATVYLIGWIVSFFVAAMIKGLSVLIRFKK